MKSKSMRNAFYLFTAFVLLSIFWSTLSHFFTNLKFAQIEKISLFVFLITFSTWLLIAAKLKQNEITSSRTQELLFYVLTFPLISLGAVVFFKVLHNPITLHIFPFVLGSMLIAALTWLLLRLNENLEFSFGRKIIVHSKLSETEYKYIAQSLVSTRLENHIELGRAKDLNALKDIDLFIVSNTTHIDDEVLAAHLAGVKIESFDQFIISLHGRINPNRMISADFLSMKHLGPAIMFYQTMKNFLEPIIAFFMLTALLPVLAFISAMIKMTSKGPAIFSQTRTGLNGKTFTLYKFRTMKIDAEKDGPKWWTPEDDRVTAIGKFLRAAHLDELPQLLNVIKGEMSFVGPRPELPAFYESLKKDIPHFQLRTQIKPGVTGWAQIKGGYANCVDSSKIKLELDLYYMMNVNPLLDMQIVLDTLTGNKNKVEATIIEEGLAYETVLKKD